MNTPYRRHYDGLGEASTTYPISAFVTHMLYLKGTLVPVDVKAVTVRNVSLSLLMRDAHCLGQALGVKCVEVVGATDPKTQAPRFSAGSVRRAIMHLLEEDSSP